MEKKWQYLQKLYEIDPYGDEYYDGISIGNTLSLSEQETISIIRFLTRKDYINTVGDNWDQLGRYDIILLDKGIEFIESNNDEINVNSTNTKIQSPICFISHISSDESIAIALQSILEKKFDNKLNVFVSCDNKSLDGGTWFSQILSSIKNATIGIVICTPESILRPWILFEAGGLATRLSLNNGDKPAFPLYLLYGKGLNPSNLNEPLKSLQALPLGDLQRTVFIIQKIEEHVGLKSNEIIIESLPEWDTLVSFNKSGGK